MQFDLIIPLAGMATACVLGLPVIRAVVRLIDRKSVGEMGGQGEALRAEVEELRARLESQEEVGHRVAELEERLDFAERVLSQQRDRDRLAPGA
jgi:Tfp pilus assembly protein PilN